MNLIVQQELAVDWDGHLEHAVVSEVLPRVVWLQLDSCILDVPFDPADSRLHPWPSS